MRYLIDIDGTLVTQQKPGGYENAEPLKESIESVNASYDKGNQIVLYTSRNFKFMQLTEEQMRAFGYKFHHICFLKPHADRIIDDRAERFTSWEDMRKRKII